MSNRQAHTFSTLSFYCDGASDTLHVASTSLFGAVLSVTADAVPPSGQLVTIIPSLYF